MEIRYAEHQNLIKVFNPVLGINDYKRTKKHVLSSINDTELELIKLEFIKASEVCSFTESRLKMF